MAQVTIYSGAQLSGDSLTLPTGTYGRAVLEAHGFDDSGSIFIPEGYVVEMSGATCTQLGAGTHAWRSAVPGTLPTLRVSRPDGSADQPLLIETPELDIALVRVFEKVWWDKGSGAEDDVMICRPVLPSGFVRVAHLAVGAYRLPESACMAVLRDKGLNPDRPALARPLSYALVWSDDGSGANADVGVWRPIPPEGYVALGHVAVASDSGRPAADAVLCVRADLTDQADIGALIWADHGSGADHDFAAYGLRSRSPRVGEMLFHVGGFVSDDSYTRPGSDAAARVLRLPLPTVTQAPGEPTVWPKLNGPELPPIWQEEGSTLRETVLPWFAVSDPRYASDAERAAASPTYTVVRRRAFRLEGFLYNRGSQSAPLDRTWTFAESNQQTESFSRTTGISTTITSEVAAAYGGVSAKVSVGLTRSEEVTLAQSTTQVQTMTGTSHFPLEAPAGGAAACWSIHEREELRRADGSLVSQSGTLARVPELMYSDEWTPGEKANKRKGGDRKRREVAEATAK